MRAHIAAEGIANRVRMLRSKHKGSFVLVEGAEDEMLYGLFIEKHACKIQIAHGKPNLLRALEILEAEHFLGVVAIADADFSVLDGTAEPRANLLYTDGHDLETMLLASPALEKVLHQFADPKKIEAVDVRGTLLTLGRPIGYMRWLSAREGLSLLFEDIDFERFIRDKTLALDKAACLQELQNRSKKGVLPLLSIWDRLDGMMNEAHDSWHICCGHDLVVILSIGLRRFFGSQNAAELKPARLELCLRLAYERAYFATTRLWASIRAWEGANAPYVVLSP